LRPRCGRKLKLQGSRKALRDHGTRPQASHHDHVAWSPLAAYRRATLARIQPPRSARGRTGHSPTTAHDDQGKATSAGRAVKLPASPPRSRTSFRRTQRTPEGADTGRPHRTPEAGHWTPGRSDTRTGHRTPIAWTGSRGHRTLAPDTDADRATTAQPASGPPGPPHRATACWDAQLCSSSRTTRQLLGRSAGQAAPRCIAPRTISGRA
jgi:hypothetical protein